MSILSQKTHGGRLAALVLLVLPLALYIIVYLVPLGSIVSLSLDNRALSDRFPALRVVLDQGAEATPDMRAAALISDLGGLDARQQGETARLLNQEISGFRSLVLETSRNAATIPPTMEALLAFDARWKNAQYWEVIARNVSPISWRHFQKATGLKPGPDGSLYLAEGDDIYLRIMLRTLVIALQVTALTVLLGYPLAYGVANAPRRWSTFILTVILLSFWTSILVRTTAWVVLLQTNGLINTLLIRLGIVSEPVQLIFNRFGVLVAMTHVLLPFAIIPMMNVMRTIPASQGQASRSLGAGGVETFLRVYLPQSLRGVVVGGGTVFILSLGFYVTPALTGGPGDQMLSWYIADFVRRSLNWGMASALSVMLLGGVLLLLTVYGLARWLMARPGKAA
ncbi:MAG: ABC transporter permease [Gemmobacter sp.]|jgi:putative spermidine/putrescine transport system permease protein|nr:ABC transporter permease [Gemmobacter sp.]